MDAVDGQAVACLFRLPVSGHVVALRHPNGAEDLLLLESAGEDTRQALALVGRLVQPATDAGIDWLQLTVTDLDASILRLRQIVIGDRVRADVACRASGCGQRIDISFEISDYVGHRKPAKPSARRISTVAPAEEPGWFRLTPRRKKASLLAPSAKSPAEDSAVSLGRNSSGAVVFRLPTVADQLAVVGRPDAVDELARRCVRPRKVAVHLRRLVEVAMETMAPCLSGDLHGICPECGAEVIVFFDARQFCLRELSDRAAFIYQDIDLLARQYHWTERDILNMPHVRRANYAELARQEAW